jgi:hypothetical protein
MSHDRVITTTLETTPVGATHWSTRSLAAEVGSSQTAVSRIWRAFGQVRDVAGLYLNPPERAVVVLCGQAEPGVPARASHDYVRAGTSSFTPCWTWPAAR